MRIAVSGTHRTGKSSLLDELHDRLPNYRLVNEPYHLLEEEGFEFASPPSLEDFVEQLRRSVDLLVDVDASGQNVLFDRCPIDFLGYLMTHDESDAFDLEEWLPEVRLATRK